MLPIFLFRPAFLGLLAGGWLAACQPAPPPPPPEPPVPGLPMPPPPRPTADDTLVYNRQGVYFRFSGADDTAAFFRWLPPLRPLPGYHVGYARPPMPDSFFRPLPRRFRLADLRVTMYHHEMLWLQDDSQNQHTWLNCDPHLLINAWQYGQGVLEFPQVRTAAGPLTQLNRRLQARYELGGPANPEGARWEAGRGTPVWDFGLSAAQLARRPFYQGVDSSEALDRPPDRWQSDYCLLDTVRTYERFPNQVSLATLGGHPRLLGLHDYRHDEDEREPEFTDAAQTLAAQRPAYYSLSRGRRVRYDDLFGPGLAAAVEQAARPLLRQVRQQRRQLPLTAAHLRELARPRYWTFTSRGWYAVYLAEGFDDKQDGYWTQRYRLDMEVLIPYARLRAYLRP